MEKKSSMKTQWLPVEVEHSDCAKTSKIRSGRASEMQKHELLKYFEDRPDAFLASGNGAGNARAKQRVWIELAHKLNGVEGTMKPTARWAKYWNDLVSYTNARAQQAVNKGQAFVNSSRGRPRDLDQRLLRIVGKHDLLKKWLVLYRTSYDANETATTASDMHEFSDDFELSQSLEGPLQQLHASSSTFQTSGECLTANNADVYEEFEELIDDRDGNSMLTVEYVEELEIEQPKLVDRTAPITGIRKRRHSELSQDSDSNGSSGGGSEINDAIAKALSKLGSACHTLATALSGLAEVVAKQKKRRQ